MKRIIAHQKLLKMKNLFLTTMAIFFSQFASAQFNQQWLRTWDDSLHQNNLLSAAVTDNAGNIILSGMTYDSLFSSVGVRTVKYDAQGNVLWSKNYVPPYPIFQHLAATAVDANDNIYLAVDINNIPDTNYVFLLKYNSNGNLLWSTSYTRGPIGLFIMQSSKVFLDNSGNIYIGTTTDTDGAAGLGGGSELTIVKFDSLGNLDTAMFTGDIITQPTFMGLYNNYCIGIDITPSQKIYSITNIQQDTISSSQDETTDFAIQKHDTSGTRMFITKIYRSAMKDFPNSMFIGINEDIFVTGETKDSAAGTLNAKYLTTRLDSSGNILYAIERGNTAWNSAGTGIVADNAGYAYVTGYTTQFGTRDIELVKYDPSGNEVWSVYYNSPFNNYDKPNGMTFTPDGNLLISASSYNGSNYDVLMLKYDTAGTLLDSLRYNGTSNLDDNGSAMYDNAGNVYLCGSTTHSTNLLDYLLIKYGTGTTVNDLITMENGLNVYPNPASQSVFISHTLMKDETAVLKFFDMMGREIWKSKVMGVKSEIDVSEFKNGVYFIRFVSGNKIASKKLVIQR